MKTDDIARAVGAAEETEGVCLYLGIDIGTTSIGAAVAGGTRTVTLSVANGSDVPGLPGWAKEQDPDAIADRAAALADALIRRFPGIRRIGLDGQMHGILYVDEDGRAVSNLMTWQDGRGDLAPEGGESACDTIRRVTGREVHTGYGLVTHFFNLKNDAVPRHAARICTIADYVAMRLTGRKEPVTHVSNAAGLGLFDAASGRFDGGALSALGIDASILPEVTDRLCTVGYLGDIPVTAAVGDNQAAYRGAVPDGGLLLNFGTGSQMSVMVDRYTRIDGLECRPFVDGKYILSGSALCGGRAYALLERFFREYAGTGESQYRRLDELAEEGCDAGTALDVSTLFCGTRSDPSQRGSISGIGEDNFTPQAMAYGFLRGMVRELHGFYMLTGLPSPEKLTVSGNAARKSRALQKAAGEIFGCPVEVSQASEEAACGAASFAGQSE